MPHVTNYGTDENYESERLAYYYGERAKGGAGLIVHECMGVHPVGCMELHDVAPYKKENVKFFQRTANMVHENGSKIFGQLTFSGATTILKHPQVLWGASKIPDPVTKCGMIPKEMEIEDIEEVIRYYAISARNVVDGGFDGVELKMAHDGIIRQFLSFVYNQRTDEWGGSFENRVRLAVRVVEAVREEIGDNIPLGIRLCLDEMVPGGFDIEYCIKVAQRLTQDEKIDYISPSMSSYIADNLMIPTMATPSGYAMGMIAMLKEAVNVPVFGFGRINDPVMAEKILADGQADLIGMARAMIADPEWANKAKEGREDEIRRCLACNQGCIFRCFEAQPIACIQNIAAGREKKYGMGTIEPAKQKKRVMVVGGGPAGLKFAEIASGRGHKVTVYDKSTDTGGQVNIATKAPTRNDFGEIIRNIVTVAKKNGAEFKMNTDVDEEFVLKEKPDAVVIATGSKTVPAAFAGSDQPIVSNVQELLKGNIKIGRKVILFDDDAHWQAAGAALYLLERDVNLDIVTSGFIFGGDLDFSDLLNILPILRENGVEITPMSGIKEVKGNTVIVANGFGGEDKIIENVDNVIVANRNLPDEDLYFALKGKVKELYRIGDCLATRKAEHAIMDGDLLARQL